MKRKKIKESCKAERRGRRSALHDVGNGASAVPLIIGISVNPEILKELLCVYRIFLLSTNEKGYNK